MLPNRFGPSPCAWSSPERPRDAGSVEAVEGAREGSQAQAADIPSNGHVTVCNDSRAQAADIPLHDRYMTAT